MASPARMGSGESLRAEAPSWEPGQVVRRESSVRPIRTSSRRDVLATLDAIPFTPSQGVCTPSPTNMAAMWIPHPFFQQSTWGTMSGGYGSPGPSGSSGASDSSLMQSGSQPGTPGGRSMFGGASMMWSSYCQPLPYSPTALQIAAASGALGSDPSTPVRSRPGSATAATAAATAGGPFLAVMPGSPMIASPGQMMFSQYFGSMDSNITSKLSNSPPESSGSGDDGEGSDGMSSHGSGNLPEVSEAAHQIASAMCAAQQLPGEPPQQLLELASLLHAYGLVSAVPGIGAAPPASAAPLSPDCKRQQQRARQKTAPKLNSDGSVRLNARQRRTLRRAQERAMKALLEAQTKAHGISNEQAASNLASMGVASMLLGSPPPAAPHMHMAPPPAAAYMGPAAVMSPGPAPMALHMVPPPPQPDFGMGMGMVHSMTVMQHGAAAGYDPGFGGVGLGVNDAQLSMHSMMQSTPPRFGGGSRLGPGGGFHPAGRHNSGGYRGTPSNGRMMSRFAPADAVAAY